MYQLTSLRLRGIKNWQIPDLNTCDSEVSFNINNDSITTESMNVVHSLETGWESHVIRKKSGWGILTQI